MKNKKEEIMIIIKKKTHIAMYNKTFHNISRIHFSFFEANSEQNSFNCFVLILFVCFNCDKDLIWSRTGINLIHAKCIRYLYRINVNNEEMIKIKNNNNNYRFRNQKQK